MIFFLQVNLTESQQISVNSSHRLGLHGMNLGTLSVGTVFEESGHIMPTQTTSSHFQLNSEQDVIDLLWPITFNAQFCSEYGQLLQGNM